MLRRADLYLKTTVHAATKSQCQLFKPLEPEGAAKDFQFEQDRCRYLHWLIETEQRFFSVLNYIVMSNPVHLLAKASIM